VKVTHVEVYVAVPEFKEIEEEERGTIHG